MVEVEERGNLLPVGLHVAGDVIVGQGWPVGGATRRVADLGGDVPDDEDDTVGHALEPTGDDHRYGVADVDVGGGGVDAELDHELALLGLGGGQQFGELAGGGQ